MTAAIISAAVVLLPAASACDASGITAFPLTALSGASLAFLLLTLCSPWPLLLPLGAFISALLVLRDPGAALVYAAFLPAGAVLALSIGGDRLSFLPAKLRGGKAGRTETVVSVSAVTLVIYLLYAALSVAAEYGGLSGAAFKSFYETESGRLRDVFASLTLTVDGETVRVYSDEVLDYVVKYMLLMLPAVLICATNILSYLCTLFFRGFAYAFGMTYLLPDGKWGFTVSKLSAYVFCGAYLLAMLGGGLGSDAISAVTSNIVLILTPPFALMGTLHVARRARSPEGRGVAVVYALLAFVMLFLNLLAIFALAAFVGVLDVLTEGKNFIQKRRY